MSKTIKSEYVEFKNNGASCFYHKSHLDNPYMMERLAKELQSFCKVFFDNGEENWGGVMDERDVDDFFSSMSLIKEEI